MFDRAKKKKKKQLEKGQNVKTKYTCYVFPQFPIVHPLAFLAKFCYDPAV